MNLITAARSFLRSQRRSFEDYSQSANVLESRAVSDELPCRPLIFVAHPDDETLACAGLVQRVAAPHVVFATDGAAPGLGGDRIYGSLQAYSEIRFQEAFRALAHVPRVSFQRLKKTNGTYFVEVHLFEELPEAFLCLCGAVRSFSPNAIISHAYEGAHIDHDACSFLAMHTAAEFSIPHFEVPLYWLDEYGKVVRQQFRDAHSQSGAPNDVGIIELRLTEAEIDCKKKMIGEYHSQQGTVSSFALDVERMRRSLMTGESFSRALCHDYMFQERRPRFYHTRHHRLPAKALLKKFAEFETWRTRSIRESTDLHLGD